MASPTLLATSEKIKRKFTRKSRRGPLDDKPLPALPPIPENSSPIVPEERGWNVGLGKPLPSLPSPVESVTSPNWETSTSPVLQTESVPDTLAVATTAYVTRHPGPRVVSIPQPKVSALPALKTNLPQDTTRAPRMSQKPKHPLRPPPAPPVASASHKTVRAAPKVGPTARRLKSRDTSTRLRDAFNGTEASHIPAVPPPTIERKPLPETAFPAYMTLPSQVEERKREAGEAWQRTKAQWSRRQTPTQEEELFLNTSMQEDALDQGEMPSSLTPPATPGTQNLTRISTMFNRFSLTGDELSLQGESPAPKSYTAYSGSPARNSAQENPLMSYAAHQARRTMAVEFDGRNHHAAPRYATNATYSPVPETMITSQLPAPHYVPEEFMTPTPSRNRSTKTEKSLSELPTNYDTTPKSRRKASVEFVSANSNRNPTTTPINQGKGKSISELSENPSMAKESYDGTPIELEAHSRPRMPTQDYKMSARLSTVGLYDRYELPESIPSVIAELPGTSMDSTPVRELPDVKRLSVMSFDGTVLETVL
ncbi:hypothetical protein DL98DRAFT_585996 [Cadophora sp. DSE1049]|nr:hypothetical protein DL98DRAFT_585996 [Cadophora sp. DSE1049]